MWTQSTALQFAYSSQAHDPTFAKQNMQQKCAWTCRLLRPCLRLPKMFLPIRHLCKNKKPYISMNKSCKQFCSCLGNNFLETIFRSILLLSHLLCILPLGIRGHKINQLYSWHTNNDIILGQFCATKEYRKGMSIPGNRIKHDRKC